MIEHWKIIVWFISLIGLIICIAPPLIKWILKETLREIKEEMKKDIDNLRKDNSSSFKQLYNISGIHCALDRSILNKIYGNKEREKELGVLLDGIFGNTSVSKDELTRYYNLSDEIVKQMEIAYHERMLKEKAAK